MTSFKDFIYQQFPVFIKRDDTLKDINGQGLFERYISIFGDDLDQVTFPNADGFLDIIDITINDPKFINHVADTLGRPPDIFQDEEIYRKLLIFITTVYKIKGNVDSYKLFFSLLGYNVEIAEFYQKDIKYDIGLRYDINPDGDILHDNNCPSCTEYSIIFTDVNDDPSIPLINSIDEPTLDLLKQVVFFNEPINAKLRGLIQGVKLEETFGLCVAETIVLTLGTGNNYDLGLLYNDGNIHNQSVDISSTVITDGNCGIPTPEGIGFWGLENDFEVQ